MKRPYLAWTCVIVLTTAVLTVGCGGDDSKDASVSLSNPKTGSTVQSEFTANVSLDNFEIDAANVGKQNEDGKGHLHFSLDNGKYDTPKYSGENGKLANSSGLTVVLALDDAEHHLQGHPLRGTHAQGRARKQ